MIFFRMPRKRLDANLPERNIAAHFTPWFPWCDRRTMSDGHGDYVHKYGGVYLLAHFIDDVHKGSADFLHDAVIYIGEANHLGRRWYQFERSARHGSAGHSGGHSHRAWAENTGVPWGRLHVAAYPIWFESEGTTDAPDSLARRFRLNLEQFLLLNLVTFRRGKELHMLNVK